MPFRIFPQDSLQTPHSILSVLMSSDPTANSPQRATPNPFHRVPGSLLATPTLVPSTEFRTKTIDPTQLSLRLNFTGFCIFLILKQLYQRDQFRTNILEGQVQNPSYKSFLPSAAFLNAHLLGSTWTSMNSLCWLQDPSK